MKFTFTSLAFAALLSSDPLMLVQAKERQLKGGDIEGELSSKTGDCKLECEWKAKNERRGLVRANSIEETTFITVDDRRLKVVLKDVECTLEIGEDEFKKKIEFPTGWTIVKKEADGAKTYFGFTTTITVSCFISSLC
jgi:hypothetical protein